MNKSIVELLTVEQTANQQLQQEMYQSTMIHEYQMDALQELMASNYQRNFITFLPPSPYFMEVKKRISSNC